MSFITSPGVIVPPLTAGGVAYGTGGQAKVNSAGTAGQVLVSGGAGVPTFSNASAVAVTSFSGGSTGLTPATPTGGAVSLGGTLSVANGGTSLATLTANNVILGNGTSAPNFVAPGASGNLLQSNGTTWASVLVAPANVNTFTASGSIASGSPVQVNNDGTVSAPTVSTVPTSFTTAALAMGSNNQYSSIVYMPSLNVYVCFATDLATSYLAAKIGTPATNGTVSWGSNIVLNAKVGSGQIAAVNCSNLTNTVAIYYYSGTDSLSYLYAATITASTITIGAEVSCGIRGQIGGIAWDSTNSKGVTFQQDASNSSGVAFAFTISGTTVTRGSGVSVSAAYNVEIEYDATSGYFLLVYRPSSGVAVTPATVSGTTITTYSTLTGSGYSVNGNTGYGIGYVASAGKVLLAIKNTSETDMVSVYINMSGSTASFVGGASLTISTLTGIALGVDNTNNVVEFLYSSSNAPYIVNSPVSGTTITYGTPVSIGGSTTQGVGGTNGKLPYNTSQSRILAYYSYTGATYFTNYVTFVTATTTLTAANYIGVSTAAYTNGQTASITTLGGKTTVVTGITAGSIMYASGTGYTTTNSGVVAGRGLSSTSMLVSYS